MVAIAQFTVTDLAAWVSAMPGHDGYTIRNDAYDRAVGSSLIVRPARVQDVAQMARVHVRCWQETYRGLMPDAVLDDPGFPAARERMWGTMSPGTFAAPG